MSSQSRRSFLKTSLYTGGALLASEFTTLQALADLSQPSCDMPGSLMRFGLVTYKWGEDWTLPTIIKNCEKTKVLGVELRTEHAHGVEANLNAQQRQEVKKRFQDSPVTLVGMGCNFDFHSDDQARVKRNIEGAKEYAKLSYDCGGSGVKVKPNRLTEGVPIEKTCEQIGKSLNEVGKFAADYKQQIRVEVHGKGTCDLTIIKNIFDHVTEPNVGVCWNSNQHDLEGKGLEYNFNLVKDRFGSTCHIRELNVGDYPYQQLFDLFVKMNYKGWILLEARTKVDDRIKALAEQRELFYKMIAQAQKDLKQSCPKNKKSAS